MSPYGKQKLPFLYSAHHSLCSVAGFEPQPAHLPQTPAARAAGLTYATMLFRQRLRSGKLAPEMINGVELCMNSYRSVSLNLPLTYPLIV